MVTTDVLVSPRAVHVVWLDVCSGSCCGSLLEGEEGSNSWSRGKDCILQHVGAVSCQVVNVLG